jgi:hypothetical protein
MMEAQVVRFYIGPMLLLLLMPAVQALGEQQFPPLEISKAKQYPACPGQQSGSRERVQALDISQPVDDKFLDEAWNNGVRVIFRYYDWEAGKDMTVDACRLGDRTQAGQPFDFAWKPGPTMIGKALTAEERDRLHARGFSIGVVFQHCNDKLATFVDTRRGLYDARRALESARQLVQPKSTTIFFSVDLDVTAATITYVERYFRTLNQIVKPKGYKIGVYGNGFTCSTLKKAGLADFCWLSQSTGFQDSLLYERGGQWDLKQCAARRPFIGSRIDFDANILNSRGGNIGLWQSK